MFMIYIMALAISLLAIGIAGVVSSRNFVIIILSTELIIAGSILAAVSFFSASTAINGSFGILIISLWVIAGVDIIMLVAFYISMKQQVGYFNVNKLNRGKG